jgi:cellulose synthase/poly-beta-1,6-N-acetylglucosamine synthase-like glycosyltransferase
MGTKWLSSIITFVQVNNAALVSGPVVFSSQKSFFHKILQLEFAGLVGIGAAALRLKSPNMCNGANLAYRKDTFNEVGGYTGNDNLPSGDDEFLMHKVFAKYPERVFFLKNRDAVVETPTPATFSEFLNQRMRWVSKSTQYSDKKITLLLALAYLFNLSILVNGVLAFANILFLYVFIIQVVVKVFSEYLFYGGILEFFNLKSLRAYILPAQPFHIAYVLVIGILGNFGKYSWKGRKQ